MEAEVNSSGYAITLIDLEKRRCVVVGGGVVAERKVAGLLAADAQPIVISPTLTNKLAGWLAEGRILHHARHYVPGDLDGAFLVFAATNDSMLNAAIAAVGAEHNVLVNVADQPELGAFHTVATLRRGGLLLTASTGGASPALAAYIIRQLEAQYGDEYRILTLLLRQVRSRMDDLPLAARGHFWQQINIEQLLELVRLGQVEQAEAMIAYLEKQEQE